MKKQKMRLKNKNMEERQDHQEGLEKANESTKDEIQIREPRPQVEDNRVTMRINAS